MQLRPILIVDDEPDMRDLLERQLQGDGFDTLAVGTGLAALEMLERQTPALVLLDLMLPDLRGTEVCRRIRANPRTAALPVIILSARGEEIDRVVGFEVGADDYVVKTNLSVRELVLRIRAVLRRRSIRAPDVVPIDHGLLSIDREGHRAWVRGIEVGLTPTEFKLLCTLADSPGRAQSRHQLLRDLWDGALDARTVDTHVKRLREKLGDAAGAIVTVRGVGYRFELEALDLT